MESPVKRIRIAVSAALQDAGEATRSIEILKAVRDYAPEGYRIDAAFLSHGGRFEKAITDNGFKILNVSPRLDGVGFHNDLKPNKNNFVGSPELAEALLKGEISTLSEFRPDVVIYGFWPFASLARRMVNPQIPGICFLPLPLEKNIYCSSLMKDIPDQIKPLTFLPVGMRRAIFKRIPLSFKLKAPILRQQFILEAAEKCGFRGDKLENLFDLLKSDLLVVNDLKEFYKNMEMPANIKVTGPLYSQPDKNDKIDPNILRLFQQNNGKTKIFCSMGSSGKKENLIEAVKAIASLPAERFSAVILVPKAVCPFEDAAQLAKGKDNLYLTDQFVPAKLVNAMADIVICHGGQGTVQTAMASGTPIVGFAMQPEQQINLDNIVLSGAGIRLPATRWKKHHILSAVKRIERDKRFRKNAERLAQLMGNTDSNKETASAIWNFILGKSAGER